MNGETAEFFINDLEEIKIKHLIYIYLFMKYLLLLGASVSFFISTFSQSSHVNKATNLETSLYKTIADLDSALFTAYNSKNLALMKTYFTKDLEWFQDNGGLIHYDKVFENFQSIFNRDYALTRTLIKENLEVHPIQGYGAIEIGSHQFKHIENGKLEVGTFKFLMIWKNDNGKWRIARVISYNH